MDSNLQLQDNNNDSHYPAISCVPWISSPYALSSMSRRQHMYTNIKIYKKNSMVWVSERTIPTERPPLVVEVIANFCGKRMSRGQRDGSLRPYSRFSRQEPLLFYQVFPPLYSRGWVDPVPDPITFFLMVVPGIEPGSQLQKLLY
jgi:hypothetical protein